MSLSVCGSYKHSTELTDHGQHFHYWKKAFIMIFLCRTSSSVPFISFDTQHFLNPLTMTSGEMSFLAVLIHCPSTLLQIVFCLCSWAVPRWQPFPIQAKYNLKGLLIPAPRTCNREIMPPGMITKMWFFTFSVPWPWQASKTIIPINLEEHVVSAADLSQPFNLQFSCHPLVLSMFNYNTTRKFSFFKILSTQSIKYHQFPPISQHWKHHAYSHVRILWFCNMTLCHSIIGSQWSVGP